MSFSEYNGSKTKVSHTVTRILKNAQENLPKIQSPQVGALLKSLSSGGNKSGSERLNKPPSPQNSVSKFGFQKLRLGLDKKRNSNHHAELLDNQDGGDQDSGDDEADTNQFEGAPSSASALIGHKKQGSPLSQKQKRWPF